MHLAVLRGTWVLSYPRERLAISCCSRLVLDAAIASVIRSCPAPVAFRQLRHAAPVNDQCDRWTFEPVYSFGKYDFSDSEYTETYFTPRSSRFCPRSVARSREICIKVKSTRELRIVHSHGLFADWPTWQSTTVREF